eukprot:m.37606 g.37606  ORF g.37606 m.37606 type:complete len:495 (+) comp9333_c0_seq1:140-1624(+)
MATEKKSLQQLVAETSDFNQFSEKEAEALLGVLGCSAARILQAKEAHGASGLANLLQSFVVEDSGKPPPIPEKPPPVPERPPGRPPPPKRTGGDDKDRGQSFLMSFKRKPKAKPTVTIKEEPDKVDLGKRTGSLELSHDDQAAIMSKMLKDIGQSQATTGGDTTKDTNPEQSIESALAMVQLRKKLAKAYEPDEKSDAKKRNRKTVIEHEFVASEDDLKNAIRDSEFLDYAAQEEQFDEAHDDLPQSPDNTPMSLLDVELSTHGCGSLPVQDRFEFQLTCGKVTWLIKRYYTDFIELRNSFFADGFKSYAESLPHPRPDPPDTGEELDNDISLMQTKETGKNLAHWLDDICKELQTQMVLDNAPLEEFLEAFWNVREARRAKDVPQDFLVYTHADRTKAEGLLKGTPEGTFLIRGKAGSTSLVLSVSHGSGGGFWHGIIELLPPGSPQPKYRMTGTRRFHPSLDDLLEFFKSTPYSLQGGKDRLLTKFLDDEKK